MNHDLKVSRQITTKQFSRLGLILIAAWLPALLWSSKVADIANLFSLAETSQPYFIPEHGFLLYFFGPLIVLSACVLFLSPGLILSIALKGSHGVAHWIFSSIAASLLVISATAAVVQSTLQTPLRGEAFAWMIVAISICSFVLLIWRNQNSQLVWPMSGPASGFTAFSMILAPYLILVALLPKFFWENFNGDGAHAYESARLLLHQALPFWPPSAGSIATYPGVTSMLFAFPVSWFIRLFGEFEVTARLPMLIYIAGVFGGVVSLIGQDREKRPGIPERVLIWFALLIYVMVISFNGTYSPYSADIALPPARETLMIACFLGFILAFVRKQYLWMTLFLLLTFFSLPTGFFFMGLWLGGVFLVLRPRPWKALFIAGACLVACLVLNSVLPPVMRALDLPEPGREFTAESISDRLGFNWSDWPRLLFLILPSGILPALSLFAWKKQDSMSRALTITTLLSFLFFYIQSNTALHHFMPPMILPLIVFWRMQFSSEHSKRVLTFAASAALIAFVVSLPQNYKPHTTARLVASAMEDRTPGYENSNPDVFRRATTLLPHLFPMTWSSLVPHNSYGGSPLVWCFYAHRKKSADQTINYVLQSAQEPAPEGMTLIASNRDASLYVRSDSEWKKHRALRPPTPPGSRIYSLSRKTLFPQKTGKN